MESRQVTAFCPFRQVIKVNSFRVASSSYDVFTAISGFFWEPCRNASQPCFALFALFCLRGRKFVSHHLPDCKPDKVTRWHWKLQPGSGSRDAFKSRLKGRMRDSRAYGAYTRLAILKLKRQQLITTLSFHVAAKWNGPKRKQLQCGHFVRTLSPVERRKRTRRQDITYA